MPEARPAAAKTLAALLAWLQENKVTFNEEAIAIVARRPARSGSSNIVSADGFGVVAQRDLIEEEPLVVIPKSAVISPATSALANVFEDEELGGGLALTIAVMYELALGTASPWHGYLQSLPRCADIPLVWDAESRKWLAGTDVAKCVTKDEENLHDDFGVLQRLIADHPAMFRSQNGISWDSFACFLDVSSLVSSRAFMVDDYRGNSMVPFADIFNHLSAGANVHIESEEAVCMMCGKEYGCEHLEASDDSDADDTDEESGGDGSGSEAGSWAEDSDGSDGDGEEDDEDESEGEGEQMPALIDENGDPVCSVGPGSASAGARGDGASDDDDDDEASMSDEEYMMDGTLDMVVFKPCKAGREVFNTYGDHGSAYLLHRYGFCDANNPFDSVSIDSADVLQAVSAAVSEKRATGIATIIDKFGHMFVPQRQADDDASDSDSGGDCESDDGEAEDDGTPSDSATGAFAINAPGHPDTGLATLLALALSDEAVFEQVAQSDDVFRHFFPIIRGFWAAFQDRLDAGAPVASAFRAANKDGAVKKATVGMVCRAALHLAEKRLAQLGDDTVLGSKPSDRLHGDRWESAKQLRANERLVLQQCVKKYKKIVPKLL
ncbi:hypothetical protein LPJ61_004008 [Coemansia biformis]|uniref:SET domain-containing protein n=1 Tax=Coemansia biformis TaxID=1286918 RepID=A0A9W7YBQ4_9FUNG|nr:hypothetical protein LPJ61_004008 [Coemansia biformis]